MNWAAYPEYKNSGVDWLGDLPAHWCTKPLWSMFTRIKKTGFPDEAMLSVYRDHGVVLKDSRDDNINKTAEDRNIYQLVGPGWLVTNRMKAWQGSVGISSHRGIVSGHYICFRPEHDEVDSYLNQLLRSSRYIAGYQTLSRGVRPGQAEIDNDLYRSMPIVVPPKEDQLAIAEFLDAETRKIDVLIAKQELLINTLREDRTATITNAVTKGLDPDVEMKASGLPWAGDVPRHWQVVNIRRVASMKTGHTPSRSVPAYWENTTIPWFTVADVWQLRDGRRTYLGETSSCISELGLANSAADLLPAGTVVLSRTASVGFTGIMPIPMATSQDYWNWVCGPQLSAEYLMNLFRSMRDHFSALMIGSTHKTIYQADAAGVRIPLPPVSEQQEIAEWISDKAAAIDTLIDKANEVIETLREYRSALITDAVTGKIDVRGVA